MAKDGRRKGLANKLLTAAARWSQEVRGGRFVDSARPHCARVLSGSDWAVLEGGRMRGCRRQTRIGRPRIGEVAARRAEPADAAAVPLMRSDAAAACPARPRARQP